MKQLLWKSDALKVSPDEMDWTVTVIEALPNCPSVKAGWERIATQTRWDEWRSESKMRGKDVTTAVISPAREPLKTGDRYIVRVGNSMKIHCRVIESSSPDTTADRDNEMVFDAVGVAMGGLVNARFRFTVFKGREDVIMARAQEKIMSLPFLAPSVETLESEHRHTFKNLNESFLTSSEQSKN